MGARYYQTSSITKIREVFSAGKRKVLLWLATGGGKTYVFCLMILEAHRRGRKCIVVVRGRKLVDQASERLFREKVPHGVFMANHWNYRPNLPIQICSIDTLLARDIRPEASLIIVDEAHQATSPGFKKFLTSPEYQKSFIVAVTATPYPEKGNLTHVADEIVHPISMLELMAQGFLVKFRYFSCQSIELDNISVRNNEYIDTELAEAMIAADLEGDIVKTYLEKCSNRPALYFTPTIRYSKRLIERFKKEGIKAEHCDADTPEDERNAILDRSMRGITQVISNVGIWGTGVDLPWISAIGLARSVKSYNLFIQQCGRGTRPFYADGYDLETIEGRLAAIMASVKPDCMLLDHGRNITRHEYPTDEPEPNLEGNPVTIRKKSKTCKKCGAIYRGIECDECGHRPTQKEREEAELLESERELIELKNIETNPIKRHLKNLRIEQKEKGKANNWASHRLIDKYGYDKASPYLTPAFIEKYLKSLSENAFGSSPYSRKKTKWKAT